MYREQAFVDACERARPRVVGYAKGIGQYGNSQHEVVLELQSVPMSSVHGLGGRSGSREEIIRMYLNREPAAEELDDFDSRLRASGGELGPRWITGHAKDRVLAKTRRAFGVIKTKSADGEEERTSTIDG